MNRKAKKKSMKVKVAHWSNLRTLIENRKSVMLEIALSHNHCATCSDRVRYVTRMLAQRNIQYSWVYPEGSKSFIEIAHPGKGVSITSYLSGVLDLAIN